MPNVTFTDEMFTPTTYTTAAQKAAWANSMQTFLEMGCPQRLFTKALYDGLAVHMYGHIAHFSRDAFYAVWFADDQKRMAWLTYAAGGGVYGLGMGSPHHTWSDVETKFTEWIRRNTSLVGMYQDRLDENVLAETHRRTKENEGA